MTIFGIQSDGFKSLWFLGRKKGEPLPVTQNEIDSIMNQMKDGLDKPKPSVSFEIGEQVRVSDGPFSSFNGMVEEVDEEKLG